MQSVIAIRSLAILSFFVFFGGGDTVRQTAKCYEKHKKMLPDHPSPVVTSFHARYGRFLNSPYVSGLAYGLASKHHIPTELLDEARGQSWSPTGDNK
jgi:hypothetical protein